MNKINVFLMCLVTGFIAPIPAYSMPESLLEDSLTLKQRIEIALRNSHEISIASGNVSKAKIGVKDARSGFLPELYLSGGYNVNDTYDKFEWNENHYSLYLSASITPFTSGRTLINVARAGASLSSARESYSITETSLILDVIGKYYYLLQARELLELRKESIFQKRKDLEFAQARFDLGLAPKADISSIKGIGAKTAMLLKENGFNTVDKIAKATVEDLSKVPGIGPATAEAMNKEAKNLLAKSKEEAK